MAIREQSRHKHDSYICLRAAVVKDCVAVEHAFRARSFHGRFDLEAGRYSSRRSSFGL
jgi:hypothetical protein